VSTTRLGLIALVLAAVAAVGVLTSACGGSSGDGVASVDYDRDDDDRFWAAQRHAAS
jgi:hypothetical protein